MRFVYPERISFFTKPEAGKQYGLRFTWETTEDLTERNVRDAFEVIAAHFKAKYPIRFLIMMGTLPERGFEPEIQFVPSENLDFTLKEMWDELEIFALAHYIDFTFKETVIYKPRFPWWLVILIATIGTGTTVAIVKKMKKKR